jgi:hypothetical protein
MSMNHAFHPETVEALSTAFHKSWSFISHDPRFALEDPALLQAATRTCAADPIARNVLARYRNNMN